MIFIAKQLVIHNLSVSYHGKLAVDNASFSIDTGAVTGLIGPNGAGKSTLMAAMLGLVKAQQGTVSFDGQPLEQVRKHIAYVKQKNDHDLTFPIQVKDVVMMGLYHHQGFFKYATALHKQKVQQALAQVEMEAYAKTQISQLSGGQLQRVFMAQVIAQDPQYIFLDEPFAAIDASSERKIIGLLKHMSQQGKTIVMVHHDLSKVIDYFDQVVLLNQTVYAYGDTATTFTKERVLATFNDPVLAILQEGL